MIEMYRSISRLYRMEEDVCIFCGKHENPKEERVMVELKGGGHRQNRNHGLQSVPL